MTEQLFNAIRAKYNIIGGYLSEYINVDGKNLTPFLLGGKCIVTRNVAEGINGVTTSNNDRIRDVIGYRCSTLLVFGKLPKDIMSWLEYDVLKRGLYEHTVIFDDHGRERTALMHPSPNSSWTAETINGLRSDGQTSFIDMFNQTL